MTMDFTLANGALVKGIEAGARVEFEFVERGAGEWVITKLTRASDASTPSAHSSPSDASRPSHTGH
jgi:hypothetical protein